MHVRIVTEICEKLGIPCVTGVDIEDPHRVGNQNICVADIIRALGHRKPKTFGNHHGWVHAASVCLSYLETHGHDDECDERFVQQARELLHTPLRDAAGLERYRYGNMKDFMDSVKAITRRRGIGRR